MSTPTEIIDETVAAETEATNELAQMFEAQQRENAEKFQALLAQGARPAPADILNLRLELLLDLLLPEGGAFRGFFDQVFERKLGEYLDDLNAHVARSKLTEGVSGADLRV